MTRIDIVSVVGSYLCGLRERSEFVSKTLLPMPAECVSSLSQRILAAQGGIGQFVWWNAALGVGEEGDDNRRVHIGTDAKTEQEARCGRTHVCSLCNRECRAL